MVCSPGWDHQGGTTISIQTDRHLYLQTDHHLYLQTASGDDVSGLHSFAEAADRQIGMLNCEYQEKRETGRLASIECFVKSDADWERFRQNRLKIGGGSEEQYKHPFLLPDAQFTGRFDALMAVRERAN